MDKLLVEADPEDMHMSRQRRLRKVRLALAWQFEIIAQPG